MMLDDRLYEQQWVQELSNEDFRLLMYLFFFASKSGIVELNMRMINFVANTGKQYRKEEVLLKFGNLIKLIPGKDNTAIFPDWIDTNWAKGKPIDPVRNPLFKSIVNELGSFGLTLDDVNRMAKKKVEVKGGNDGCEIRTCDDTGDSVLDKQTTEKSKTRMSNEDIDNLFDAFWKAYPKKCPRKVDKAKCFAKFSAYLRGAKDAVQLFNQIMEGLAVWMQCDTWVRDGGQYIMAPLRWLNNKNWNDTPMKGNSNGTAKGCGKTANANYKSESGDGIF